MTHEIIIAIVTSGVISSIVTFFLSLRKDKRNDYTTIIETYRAEFDRQLAHTEELEHSLEEHQKEIKSLNEEINKIKLFNEKYRMLEPMQHALPIPFWIKDINGCMLYANEKYENDYLLPNGKTLNECVGRTDYDIWGNELGKLYTEHDADAIKHGTIIRKEYAIIDSKRVNIFVVKYPIKVGKVVIGVGGLALDAKIFKQK